MKPAQEVTRGLHADLICLSSPVQHHHRTLSTHKLHGNYEETTSPLCQGPTADTVGLTFQGPLSCVEQRLLKSRSPTTTDCDLI